MSFKPSKSWKEELKGYCVCFANSKHPIGLQDTPYENCGKCAAQDLYKCLASKEKPTQTTVITSMLRTSAFTRKQLVGALVDLFSCDPNSAATRVAAIIRPYRTNQGNGPKLTQDDKGRYCLAKRN